MVLISTCDCTVDDVIEDDVITNSGLSTLLRSPPVPSGDGLGHAGAVVGASDRASNTYTNSTRSQ